MNMIKLPLLSVIILLLSSADMVFNYYLGNLTEIFDNINIQEFIVHSIFILIISFYLLGYIWGFKNEKKISTSELSISVVKWEPITIITVLVALNMLFSANFKLNLYESSYGYTFLRVAVHLFMLLLFILSLVVAVGIWYRKVPILKSIIVLTIVMYTVINYINIDGFVARKNIERYYETGKVDAYYLTTLSNEAVPYLIELRDNSDSEIKIIINDNLQHRKEILNNQNSWTEFNFSKNRIRKLLN